MKFYSMRKILAKGAPYNIIYGGRASGKSYQMAKYLMDKFINEGKQFVRITRSWTQTMSLNDYFTEVASNECKDVKVQYVGEGRDRGYYLNGELFGHIIPLSLEENYKSNQYPKVEDVLYEEFVCSSVDGYLDGNPSNELYHFRSVLSTVFRHREGRVWLIGNSMKTTNPYFEWLGIDGVELNVGDLKVYDTSVVIDGKVHKGARVAVEYVPIGYQNISEVPIMMRIPNNEVALTGATESLDNVLSDLSIVDGINHVDIGLPIVTDYIGDTFRSISWEWDNHNFIITQDTTGNTLVIELYDDDPPARCDIIDVSDVLNERILDLRPITMFTPNISEMTGVMTKRLMFDNYATEVHFETACRNFSDSQKQIQRCGLTGGYDLNNPTEQDRWRQSDAPFARQMSRDELNKRIIAERKKTKHIKGRSR